MRILQFGFDLPPPLRYPAWLWALMLLVANSATGLAIQQDDSFSPDQIEFFEARVRPLLISQCFECHGGQQAEPKGGLRLDSRELAIRGGDNGPAIVPQQPDESLVVQAVRWETFEMPPERKLKDAEIAILEKWIEMGAPWPSGQAAETVAPSKSNSYDWAELRSQHWSFQPVRNYEPPAVTRPEWVKNGIDQFVLSRLEEADLQPAPRAEPRILARRIYYDLTGLPPSLEQMEAFAAAASDDYDAAVAALVDTLLDSPHYGERWGRHWLDVARYSDGHGGFSNQAPLPHAWRYRDWVVDAFNRDLPFDQFARLQIAGDILDEENQLDVATGFFSLGPTYVSDGGDPDSVAQAKSETLDDRIDTLTRGFLGLTVSCARCHDHKFDPIPQQDYYSLAGVFNNSGIHLAPVGPAEQIRRFDELQGQINALQNQINKLRELIKKEKRSATPDEEKQLQDWQPELDSLKKSLPPKYDQVHALRETGQSDMAVAIRGNLRKPGPVAPRRFLQILTVDEPLPLTEASGRRQLAEAIASRDNPLTARVWVNRVWMHHFGRALVRTPSNFGELGDQPTHPRLLDWLAHQFTSGGWSVKSLHRWIMNSATYQMSSQFDAAGFARDGDNRLIWRMNPRRLGAEAWRDTLLSVTGELEEQLGGPSTEDVNSKRRTLYFKVSRNGDRFASDQFLRLFDFPLMQASVAKRPTSIVPQQFLFLMNSPFMQDRARALAARLKNASDSDRDRISLAYQWLHGRQPTDQETEIAVRFLKLAEPAAEPVSNEPGNDPIGAETRDLLIADFEGDSYGQWKPEGTAFGNGPARGTLPRQMSVSGFLGRGLVNSFFDGDGTVGKLTSPDFQIQRRQIHFLVGGGKYPGKTCVNLLVGDQVVRTATGPNDRGGGSEKLDWHSWDVAEFVGKSAVIQIIDDRTGGWGHINADHFFQSNRALDAGRIPGLAAGQAAGSSQDPWEQFAQVLLCSNELMYLR